MSVKGYSSQGPAVHADGDLLVENDAHVQQALQVEGDATIGGSLRVTNAIVGDIGPQQGSPFPRPAFDSGWTTIGKDQAITLQHGVGWQADDYFADIQCRSDRLGIHNLSFIAHVGGSKGVSYSKLSSSDVNIHRRERDGFCHEVRFRIWVIK